MKLFFDEDTGKSVPEALRALRICEVEYVRNNGPIKKGTPDEVWLPFAGAGGYLVFSCNTGILRAEAQRNLLVEKRVGAVFLNTGQGTRLQMMKLILNQWDWLEDIDANEPRPFAFLVTLAGRKSRARL